MKRRRRRRRQNPVAGPSDATKGMARASLVGLAGSELFASSLRFQKRGELYEQAEARARALGRTLVVVGDPDTGTHTRLARAYGCGDLCVDLTGCPSCPVGSVVDLSAGQIMRTAPNGEALPVADDSAVVYCSCVLEYVPDALAAWRELVRIAGSPENVFLVTVQTWSPVATLYPGARWRVSRTDDGGISLRPVTGLQKAVYWSAIGAALWAGW